MCPSCVILQGKFEGHSVLCPAERDFKQFSVDRRGHRHLASITISKISQSPRYKSTVAYVVLPEIYYLHFISLHPRAKEDRGV